MSRLLEISEEEKQELLSNLSQQLKRLVKFARRVLIEAEGPLDLAADVVQQAVAEKILPNLHGYDPLKSDNLPVTRVFESKWARQIIRRTAIDESRKERSQRRRAEEAARLKHDATAASAADEAIYAEGMRAYLDLRNLMPEKYRVTLEVLEEEQELKTEEERRSRVQERLGRPVPVDLFRLWKSRASARVRDSL